MDWWWVVRFEVQLRNIGRPDECGGDGSGEKQKESIYIGEVQFSGLGDPLHRVGSRKGCIEAQKID